MIHFKGNGGVDVCDPTQRVIKLQGSDAAFNFQDHAIGVVDCLTIESVGTGSTGVSTRQFTIGDIADVIFGPMPGGAHIVAREMSRVDTGRTVYIRGDAHVHVSSLEMSSVHLGGVLMVGPGYHIDIFAFAVGKSLINAADVTILQDSIPTIGHTSCNDASSTLIDAPNGLPGDLGWGC